MNIVNPLSGGFNTSKPIVLGPKIHEVRKNKRETNISIIQTKRNERENISTVFYLHTWSAMFNSFSTGYRVNEHVDIRKT